MPAYSDKVRTSRFSIGDKVRYLGPNFTHDAVGTVFFIEEIMEIGNSFRYYGHGEGKYIDLTYAAWESDVELVDDNEQQKLSPDDQLLNAVAISLYDYFREVQLEKKSLKVDEIRQRLKSILGNR